MRGGDRLTVTATIHDSGLWIIVPLSVGVTDVIYPVLDTGSPVSAISPRIRTQLANRGRLSSIAGSNRFQLTGLALQGQSVPDLRVSVLSRLDRIGVDALLGLDFLLQFHEIAFNTRTMTLTLTAP
jgi:hypothetical protein